MCLSARILNAFIKLPVYTYLAARSGKKDRDGKQIGQAGLGAGATQVWLLEQARTSGGSQGACQQVHGHLHKQGEEGWDGARQIPHNNQTQAWNCTNQAEAETIAPSAADQVEGAAQHVDEGGTGSDTSIEVAVGQPSCHS